MPPRYSISLGDCPEDIILCIASHLPLPSVLQLRLICQSMASIVSSVALRNIKLIWPNKPRSAWHRFPTIPQPPNTVALDQPVDLGLIGLYAHAQHLTVRTPPAEFINRLDEAGLRKLWHTIRMLRSLRSLKLDWDTRDMDRMNEILQGIQGPLMDSILTATGGTLERLIVRFYGFGCEWYGPFTFPAEMLEVRGLRELEVRLDEQGWGCWDRMRARDHKPYDPTRAFDNCCFAPELWNGAQAIAESNSTLEAITIRHGCGRQYFHADALFYHHPLVNSLDIYGVYFPEISRDVYPRSTQILTRLTQLKVSSPISDVDLDNLWKALIQSGSSDLVSVETSQVSPAFVTFIGSFTGLRILIIKDLENHDQYLMPTLAHEFFNKAILSHARTLRHLSITFNLHVVDIPGWSYSPSYWVPLWTRMSSLESTELQPKPEGERFTTNKNNLFWRPQLILDGVAEALSEVKSSRLRSMMIQWPRLSVQGDYRWIEGPIGEEVIGRLTSTCGAPEVLVLNGGGYRIARLDASGKYTTSQSSI